MKVSRLKQIIKEEVQTIINEATRWGVGRFGRCDHGGDRRCAQHG